MSRYCKQSVALKALAAVVVAAAVVLMASSPVAAKNPGGGGPVLIDLHPAGSAVSVATSINNSGQIIGEINGVAGAVAGTWDGNAATPAFTPLPAADLAWSSARGQNEAGAIVGHSDLGAVYWVSRTATPVVLPMPAGATYSGASGISLHGVIVGQAGNGVDSIAVAWRVGPSGSIFGPIVLGLGQANSVAMTGANTNRAVGYSGYVLGALAWDLTIVPDGSFSVTGSSVMLTGLANAIRDGGDVTGCAFLGGKDQAFVIRSGSLIYLPQHARQHYGQGNALNASIVVGATAEYGISPLTATMWDSRGRRSSLLPSTWSYSVANGVNEAGKIVGHGDNGAGATHAWLLR